MGQIGWMGRYYVSRLLEAFEFICRGKIRKSKKTTLFGYSYGIIYSEKEWYYVKPMLTSAKNGEGLTSPCITI